MKVGSWGSVAARAGTATPLLLFVALVPTAVLGGFRYGGHDASRLLQLGVLLIGAVLFCVSQFKAEPARRHAGPWIWAAGALALASVGASAMPLMALRELALMLGLVVITLATADGLTHDADSRLAGAAVLGACALYAFVLTLLSTLPVMAGQSLAWQNLAVGYDNYRFFNHVQTVALPLLALLATRTRRWSPPWFAAWFALSVYAAFVWCSGARGTVIAIAVAMLIALSALGIGNVWPLGRTLMLAAVAGALVYIAFILGPGWVGHPLSTGAERSVASLTSDSARLQLWRIALDQIAGSPWLGVGPMHYAHEPNPKAAHPHNVYLQVAAEWGLPMLMLLLAVVARSLVRMARSIRASTTASARAEGAALWLACIALLIDGLVSGNFVMPVAQMWIALCVAWSLAWNRRHSVPAPCAAAPSPAAAPGRWRARLAGMAVLISQVWLLTAVWPEAADLTSHLRHVQRDLVHNAKSNPRFWSDGWF